MALKRALIPNSCTMGNLIMGFIAIIFASRGTGITEATAVSGMFIFIAAFFDLFDGALARALKVESPIGVQLDSLADGVSYGIAPGFISYQAYLYKLPDIAFGINMGMLLAVFFPICATFRLARFNVGNKKNGFTGLPSPAAGIVISAVPSIPFAYLLFYGRINYILPVSLFVPLFIVTAFLMVSKVDYNKLFADILKKGMIPSIAASAIILLLLISGGMFSVFLCTFLYVAAGLIKYIFKAFR